MIEALVVVPLQSMLASLDCLVVESLLRYGRLIETCDTLGLTDSFFIAAQDRAQLCFQVDICVLLLLQIYCQSFLLLQHPKVILAVLQYTLHLCNVQEVEYISVSD